MLVASKSGRVIQELKADLVDMYEMKNLGPAKKILGMEITKSRPHRVLHLSWKGDI